MTLMYSIRRGASIVGGTLFLIFGFITFYNGKQLYEAAKILWEYAKFVVISFLIALFSGVAFVWGMGWTLNDKERAKMKKYRREEKIRKKKQAELDKKRRKLLKKHGLEEKKKKR